MIRKLNMILVLLLAVSLLSGCAMMTVDQMYSLPKRSAEHQQLQAAIDSAISGLEYSSPLSGENQQTVQMADLDGDQEPEYLLFAKGTSDTPMQILIFKEYDEKFQLMQTVKNPGSAFAQIEYVNLDGKPGMELVVGLRLSGQVLRYLTVYSFEDGQCQQLMAVNYSKFLTCDLDSDGLSEILIISDGEAEDGCAVASLYSFRDEAMSRSREAALSESSDHIKRIMVSTLHGGANAVYIASTVEESAIITDVLALRDGEFCNVSLSNESGTSIQTMRNYYVYADDIDNDGTLEIPGLITMAPVEDFRPGGAQHLIGWYAMDLSGNEIDKMHTFHNFDGGWYLELDGTYARRVSVAQQGRDYTFYIWDERYENAAKVMTIFAFSGSKRQEQAQEDGRFLLHKTDGVAYAAKLADGAADYGITRESLADSFHLIHLDWKSGETE